jgi:hypothetical protein
MNDAPPRADRRDAISAERNEHENREEEKEAICPMRGHRRKSSSLCSRAFRALLPRRPRSGRSIRVFEKKIGNPN